MKRMQLVCWWVVVLPVVVTEAATTVGHGLLSITNEATTDVSIAVDGIASQTANFITIQDSGATLMFSVAVNGDVTSATGTYATSDARLKTNVTNATSGLETVKRLRPVTYQWLDREEDAPQLGFVAQEVEAVLPQLVKTDAQNNGYKAVLYDRFAVVAVSALQELDDTVQQLRADARRQAAAIEDFQVLAANLQSRLDYLETNLCRLCG